MRIEVLGYMDDPYRAAREEQQTRHKRIMIKQRIKGFAMLLIGIVAPIIHTEGITASFFFLPFGLLYTLSNYEI